MHRFTLSRLAGAAVLLLTAGCGSKAVSAGGSRPNPEQQWFQQLAFEFQRMPDTIPTRWQGLIGVYGPDTTRRWYTYESERRLWILDHVGYRAPLGERNDSIFDAPRVTAAVSGEVRFSRDSTGRATSVRVGDVVMPRRNIEPPPNATQLKITPRRPIEELRREALAASPPPDSGAFRPSELLDLVKLDSNIKLDIRYASENNFLGTRLYEQERAFLQKPAAEALVRANRVLRPLGYTLLVHDAYRPWYVTKIFWEATPDSLRWLVADPAQGSRHNRGTAVDVTLYDIETKQAVEMPSTYDEASTRAHSTYPGGTSVQRWHRALLKRALEHEGFAQHPLEWWHFDHRDWRGYPIMNVPFDRIAETAPKGP